MHRLFALLNITLMCTSITSACAASPENDVSQSTTSSTSAPPSIEEKNGGEIDAGMTVEDLILLQCSCNSTMDDPVTDLTSNKLSTAYTQYVVTERMIRQYLNDYLDLCNMRFSPLPLNDGEVANTHHDYIVYAIRKARREITTLIERKTLARESLVRMTSEAAVEALDDKHGWSALDDRQALEGKYKRPKSSEPPEPIFRDTRTAPSVYGGSLYP